MGGQVADVGGCEACGPERLLHADAHGFAVGLRDVGGVTVRRKADEFGVDPGAAGAGVLELLEHERASAFADHEAVTVGVEGTRRELGLVVLRVLAAKSVSKTATSEGQSSSAPPATMTS